MNKYLFYYKKESKFLFLFRRDPRKKPGSDPKVLNRRDPRRKNLEPSLQTLLPLPIPVPVLKKTPLPLPPVQPVPAPVSSVSGLPLQVPIQTFPMLNRRDPRKRNYVEPTPVNTSRLQPISSLPTGLSSAARLTSKDSSAGVSTKDPRIRRIQTLPVPGVSITEGPGEEQMMNIIKNPSRLSVPYKPTESPRARLHAEKEVLPIIEKINKEDNFTKSLLEVKKTMMLPQLQTEISGKSTVEEPKSDEYRYPPPVRKISSEKKGDDSDSEGELHIDMNPLTGRHLSCV